MIVENKLNTKHYKDKTEQDIDMDKISHESVVHAGEDSVMDEEDQVYRPFNNSLIEKNNNQPEFPHNLSNTKNLDPAQYHPIYFKNYIPLDPDFPIDRLPHFEKIAQIENYYERKMKKGVKEFLNLEKNPLNIVPKKNNIDLKRNLAQKLEKLNKKTELVILELIRENIQKQKEDFEGEDEKEVSQEVAKESLGNKLLMATQMQMNMQEEELKKEFSADEEDDVSSDYEKGINDL